MFRLRWGDSVTGLLRSNLLATIATRLGVSGCSLSTTCHIAWSDDAVELFGLGTSARCCRACQWLFVSTGSLARLGIPFQSLGIPPPTRHVLATEERMQSYLLCYSVETGSQASEGRNSEASRQGLLPEECLGLAGRIL